MQSFRIALLTFLFLSALGFHLCLAQDQEDAPPCVEDQPPQTQDSPSKDRERPGPKLDVRAGFTGQAPVDGGPGGYRVGRTRATVSYGPFSFTYRRKAFTWSEKNGLPFGNGSDAPWKNLHSLSLSAYHFGQFKEEWSYFALGAVTSSFEREFGPLAWSGLGWVGRSLGDTGIQVRLGGTVFYHPVRTLALPLIGLAFDPGAFMGKADSGWAVTLGIPETSIRYRFNPELAVRLGFVLESTVYRLKDDSTVEPSGFVEERDYMTGLYLHYSPKKHISLSGGLGYAFLRYLYFYDRDGDRSADYTLGGAPVGSIQIEYKF